MSGRFVVAFVAIKYSHCILRYKNIHPLNHWRIILGITCVTFQNDIFFHMSAAAVVAAAVGVTNVAIR